MSLEKDFDRAVRSIMTSGIVISLATKLNLYGLFNQAKRGDCKGSNDKPKKPDDVVSHQKWQAWKSKAGLSKTQAMEQYINLVQTLLNKAQENNNKVKSLQSPPALPPLIDKEKEEDEELPQFPKTSSAEIDKPTREKLFRSRHFSSVAGLLNPLSPTQGKVTEDIAERYELYERIRKFYQKFDPGRLNKGIGAIVEWTLENGVDKLNENLQKKYNEDLQTLEQREEKKMKKLKEEENKRRTSQIALSRRLIANTDPDTRKKMDKLTRFLLVNDPELVSRGMYLLIKFIEAKGVGALNENLKKNYGKSLDSVTDDQLNAELKKKYGNDLEMLDKPLFGELDEEKRESVAQETLKQQILNLDHEKLRTTQSNGNVNTKQNRSKTKTKTKNKRKSNKNNLAVVDKLKKTFSRSSVKNNDGFDVRTLDLNNKNEYIKFEEKLQKFLSIYEPRRFEDALKLMIEFAKAEGITNLNAKLKAKYGVDLRNFETIPTGGSSRNLSEDEFNFVLMQFVNKHETSKNIEKALKAMTGYKNKHGLEALNTKLFLKYGETLEDLLDNSENSGTKTNKSKDKDKERGVSIAEMHTVELSEELLEKLRSYYAKYDPMILASNGVERIFEWAERNGEQALDRQLKAKYKESLTEYLNTERKLKKELERFYKEVDKSKLLTGFDTVLAWALINGRDALNFNLRRKYNKDLDSANNPNAERHSSVPEV